MSGNIKKYALAALCSTLVVCGIVRATEPHEHLGIDPGMIPTNPSYLDPFSTPQQQSMRFVNILDRLIFRLTNQRNKPEWQLTERERECLARNIYHEAANEPVEGQIGVAQVTLNRARDPFYPSDVCDVVYQRATITKTKNEVVVTKHKSKNKKKENLRVVQVTKRYVVCQFSWTCIRVVAPGSENAKYKKICELVEDYAEGGYQDYREKFKKSLHYHAYYVSPNWPLNRLAQVGAHIFYD